MNGKKLDCVISHASFKEPKRLEYKLVVHYPPDVTIKGYDDNWFVGLERATLKCIAGGNPIPQNFTWSRRDSALPEGIAFEDNSLVFQRPLELSDMGVYVCLARNRVGKVTAEQSITITETEQRSTPFSNVMIIILAAVAAAVLVLMVFTVLMVNRYHKRKHKNMKTVLREKTQEIDTLSRQASFRRLNSVSTDPRLQTEENIPLRVEGTIRNSMSSLGDRSSKRSGWLGDTQIPEDTCVLPSPLPSQTETAVDHPARSRDSRSTASLGRGATDFLGRPHLMNTSRRSDRSRGERGEDREKELEENTLNTRLRVESFVRNSNLSLESRFHPPLYPSKIATDRGDLVKPINGTLMSRGRGSPDQGLPSDDISDEGDVQTSSSLISESLSNHFHVANGTLKPKPSCNGIFIHPREQMV
ncbi:NECT4 protein, partial [Amia calva]|nr:NECT4 protein [Amia calva]